MGKLAALAVSVFLWGISSATAEVPNEAEVAQAFERMAMELLCRTDFDEYAAYGGVASALERQLKRYSEGRGESLDPNRFGSALPLSASGAAPGNNGGDADVSQAAPPILDPNSIPRELVFTPRPQSGVTPRPDPSSRRQP